jgi:hypothetical protein
MTKLKRLEDGGYLIGGKKYESLKGTRRQVFDYETAYKTAGGLHKEDLVKNDKGRIVSKAKYDKGPELLKNLTKRGFYTKKGKFGHKKMKANKTRKNKKYGGDGEEASAEAPAEAPPAEAPPAEAPPAETPAAETPAAEEKPAEEKPAEEKPAEEKPKSSMFGSLSDMASKAAEGASKAAASAANAAASGAFMAALKTAKPAIMVAKGVIAAQGLSNQKELDGMLTSVEGLVDTTEKFVQAAEDKKEEIKGEVEKKFDLVDQQIENEINNKPNVPDPVKEQFGKMKSMILDPIKAKVLKSIDNPLESAKKLKDSVTGKKGADAKGADAKGADDKNAEIDNVDDDDKSSSKSKGDQTIKEKLDDLTEMCGDLKDQLGDNADELVMTMSKKKKSGDEVKSQNRKLLDENRKLRKYIATRGSKKKVSPGKQSANTSKKANKGASPDSSMPPAAPGAPMPGMPPAAPGAAAADPAASTGSSVMGTLSSMGKGAASMGSGMLEMVKAEMMKQPAIKNAIKRGCTPADITKSVVRLLAPPSPFDPVGMARKAQITADITRQRYDLIAKHVVSGATCKKNFMYNGGIKKNRTKKKRPVVNKQSKKKKQTKKKN